MELKFKQTSDTHIDIIATNEGTEKIVGRIFTPSGSGNNTLNAIQICGFKEAFDLWGCSEFQIMKETRNIKNDIIPRDAKGNLIMQQAKDIQLLFEWETQKTSNDFLYRGRLLDNCISCFNTPCTCEIRTKMDNPYVVKREQDLVLLKKVEDKKSSPNQEINKSADFST